MKWTLMLEEARLLPHPEDEFSCMCFSIAHNWHVCWFLVHMCVADQHKNLHQRHGTEKCNPVLVWRDVGSPFDQERSPRYDLQSL